MVRFHWFSGVLVAAVLGAQSDSRIGEILAEREQKAQTLAPDRPDGVEQQLIRFREGRVWERLTEGIAGLRVKFGGLVQGSGFALGPEYQHDFAGGRAILRGAMQGSLRGYQKYDLQFSLPRLAGDRMFLDVYAVRHNYASLNYYGPGADSEKNGRSNYRLEDDAIDATLGFRPARRLTLGGTAGYVTTGIRRGADRRFASADTLYRLDAGEDYFRLGSFAQYDYRDFAPGPRSGGNYFAEFSDFRGGFQRMHLEAQQYIPLLNKRRVIALRAKTALTFGEHVPFYLQPALGGSEDLRGYRSFRFRDRNMMVMNAEYRWEIFSGLDMALFADSGKVFHRRSELNFKNLESDVGFGFRLNARNRTFLRLDVGFSHEGYQVAVKFNNLFGRGPGRTSSAMGDF